MCLHSLQPYTLSLSFVSPHRYSMQWCNPTRCRFGLEQESPWLSYLARLRCVMTKMTPTNGAAVCQVDLMLEPSRIVRWFSPDTTVITLAAVVKCSGIRRKTLAKC